MTDERPMTINRICDRLWFDLTSALKDASEFDPYGKITIHNSEDIEWYTNGLMLAHKIESANGG